ncbi:YugN-like family protein [Desertibacillus haloalkaliphilus]|uniref:YugN-like family protein n=1 Tax=Desertibacillus haloalkaliphilus TaxID=1328930 RepID=UPI001C273512|nr:YugN-like family protein [Desertibacillus haloalkaliphilus]MBU8905351.1 YugN-like family protein [Desertibacillus haloalkaliphilus]
MIEMPSNIEQQQFSLHHLEKKLKPLGYDIGGNWDYDHGTFDYKIDDNGSYLFLRIPFYAVKGEVGEKGVIVQLGRPFLLAHEYKSELDDRIMDYNSFMNQFQEPRNKDAVFPNEYIMTGKTLVQELEDTLLT